MEVSFHLFLSLTYSPSVTPPPPQLARASAPTDLPFSFSPWFRKFRIFRNSIHFGSGEKGGANGEKRHSIPDVPPPPSPLFLLFAHPPPPLGKGSLNTYRALGPVSRHPKIRANSGYNAQAFLLAATSFFPYFFRNPCR